MYLISERESHDGNFWGIYCFWKPYFNPLGMTETSGSNFSLFQCWVWRAFIAENNTFQRWTDLYGSTATLVKIVHAVYQVCRGLFFLIEIGLVNTRGLDVAHSCMLIRRCCTFPWSAHGFRTYWNSQKILNRVRRTLLPGVWLCRRGSVYRCYMWSVAARSPSDENFPNHHFQRVPHVLQDIPFCLIDGTWLLPTGSGVFSLWHYMLRERATGGRLCHR